MTYMRFTRVSGVKIRQPANEPERFSRWLTLGADFIVGAKTFAVCQCDCGTIAVVSRNMLHTGHSKSCSCLQKEVVSARCAKHRMSTTKLYQVWASMIRRCHSPTAKAYSSYGGRGIHVCDRWRDSFEAFVADMGPRPTGHSVERINNNGNYEPSNCRWATNKEQSLNKRCTMWLTFYGKTRTVHEWAKISQVPALRIVERINIRGWDPKRAVWFISPAMLRGMS